MGELKSVIGLTPAAGQAATLGQTLGSAGLHGLAGGAFSAAAGGNFGSGFLAGSFGDLTSGIDAGSVAANTAIHAVTGGLGALLGGGKFENGAMTGSFGYLFNHCAHEGCFITDTQRAAADAGDWNAFYAECGDPGAYECAAGRVARDEGFFEHEANMRLNGRLLANPEVHSMAELERRKEQIRIDLVRGYVDHLGELGATAAAPKSPSRRAVGAFHDDVMNRNGAHGGFGGNLNDKYIPGFMYDYCGNCQP